MLYSFFFFFVLFFLYINYSNFSDDFYLYKHDIHRTIYMNAMHAFAVNLIQTKIYKRAFSLNYYHK